MKGEDKEQRPVKNRKARGKETEKVMKNWETTF